MKIIKRTVMLLFLTLHLTILLPSSDNNISFFVAPSIGLTDEVTGQ